MKPKRKEAPAYYEARALLAECFGLNGDTEIPQDYDDLPSSIKNAAQSTQEEN